MSRVQTKAAHYIQLLDEARCQGNWDEVPELLRKVRKHAPGRTCLTLTAEAEHAVTQTTQTRPPTGRPSTARPSTAASTNSIGVSKYIPLLLEAIEKERIYVEDEFQAQVCLGWIHWQLGEPSLAAARLPKSIEAEFAQLDGTGKESAEWTKVCALKASYIKGSSQSRTGVPSEALETFESALPVLSSASSSQTQGKELRTWTELFLSAFCLVSSHAIKSKLSPIVETETLSAFRAWAKFWETQGAAAIGGRAPQAEVSRRFIWREYYTTLSDLLQRELPFPTTALATAYPQASTRLQQRAELKRVEARYESLLLIETHFPKAEEGSAEVESFVSIVMQNWRVLCGSGWSEHDLGEGGAEGVSRGVLDILYRAATKTFHSTAVLRHLFTVHLAVAEFDLAFKAFDTYIEIVKKGKARLEKTGEAEPGLDDDEAVLITASDCIKALCRYGSRQGAEKAKDLGQFFEDWLNKYYPTDISSNRRLEDGNSTGLGKIISPRTLALAWRCIGIGHAQWARLTFEASARGGIQLQAIKCFRNALLPQYESTTDAETLFALGTILAERRELATAIEVVKSGLIPRPSSTPRSNSLSPQVGHFTRERSLIPLWHLMALLLSARQEFMTAARSCEGAFEQFQDPKNLFGDADLNGSYRSEHLNSNEKVATRTQGVVDYMDDFEKESVLEVKMTQLALIEVLEGPEVAVNASDELLSLYGRLFGDPGVEPVTIVAATPPSTAFPPRSSAGTIKSIKGSIFGRSNRSIRKANAAPSIGKSSTTLRPQTAQTTATTRAPIIQVTNENGNTAKQHQHHHLTKDQPHPHEKQKRSESLSRKKGSLRNRSTSTGRKNISGTNNSDVPTTVDGEKYFTPPAESEERDQWLNNDRGASQVGMAVSPDMSGTNSNKSSPPRALHSKSQKMAHKEQPQRPADPDPGLAQDNQLPQINPYSSSTNPPTRFSKDQERRRRTTILVKVWLFIAGFYRRAAMYDDSRGAIEEAAKLTQRMDDDISKDASGNLSTTHPGWGGGKSVAELWGGVYSELGALAASESLPYIALARFESALNHFADHPSAIVGLSNILLDIYTEDLLPPPSIPPLVSPSPIITPSASTLNTSVTVTTAHTSTPLSSTLPTQQLGPLGIPSAHPLPIIQRTPDTSDSDTPTPAIENTSTLRLRISSKEASTELLDRLAARDRAYGLLNGLTKLGTGWNYSEAWFALARAYELGGQADKAREVLWWCVELEEGRAVRGWAEAGSAGGYVL